MQTRAQPAGRTTTLSQDCDKVWLASSRREPGRGGARSRRARLDRCDPPCAPKRCVRVTGDFDVTPSPRIVAGRCESCGAEFRRSQRGGALSRRSFCSERCRVRLWRQDRPRPPRPPLTCRQCGADFTRPPGRGRPPVRCETCRAQLGGRGPVQLHDDDADEARGQAVPRLFTGTDRPERHAVTASSNVTRRGAASATGAGESRGRGPTPFFTRLPKV
jgi:hypothetical protein